MPNYKEGFTSVLAGVEAQTGYSLIGVPKNNSSPSYAFHKLELGSSEFALECNGFGVYAFSEDFSSGEKDSRMLFREGCDVQEMVAFLKAGILRAEVTPAAPRP